MNKNNIVDIIDVEQRHYQTIKETLARFLPYKKVIAYGSRVKWNASETSDLDLVVFNATQKEIYEAKEEFDESNIPFIIQILNWETIPQDFKENIEQKYHILQDKSDWGIFKLGDTIEKNQYSILNNLRKPLSSNIRSKMKDGELYPYYGAAGIIDYINDFKLNGFYLLIAEDGTVTSNGINPMLTLAMGKFWVSNHAHIISSDEDWKIKFLYYLLSSVDINEYITGAVQPKLNKANLLSIKIYLPPLPEQKAIAEILSSLDDKIDLLHRQNKTLESLAETIFRHYFIDNAKDDWEEKQLDEIAIVQNGYSFKSSDFENELPNGYEVLKMGHIEKGGGLRQNPKRSFVPRSENLKKVVLNKNDIVMAMTDMKDNVVILGVPALVDKENHYALNQRVARIYLKNTNVLASQYLLYLYLKNPIFIKELQSQANSGVQVNLTTQSIKDSEFLIPPIEKQKEVLHMFEEIFCKLDANTKQIQNLEKLRDTLLPKLISGEIRTNYKENE